MSGYKSKNSIDSLNKAFDRDAFHVHLYIKLTFLIQISYTDHMFLLNQQLQLCKAHLYSYVYINRQGMSKVWFQKNKWCFSLSFSLFYLPLQSCFQLSHWGKAVLDSLTIPFPRGRRGVNVSAREQKSGCRRERGWHLTLLNKPKVCSLPG